MQYTLPYNETDKDHKGVSFVEVREGFKKSSLEVHSFENNLESQVHLEENREHFNDRCTKVYKWLDEGKELTVLWCANNGVASLPRRIKDLRESGVLISDKWVGAGQTKIKAYYMTPEQIKINREKFKV